MAKKVINNTKHDIHNISYNIHKLSTKYGDNLWIIFYLWDQEYHRT